MEILRTLTNWLSSYNSHESDSLKLRSRKILVSVLVLWGNCAEAYFITADEMEFFAQYESPTEFIDFNSLTNGATYGNITPLNPFWTGQSIGSDLVIRDGAVSGNQFLGAWSDNYFFRSAYTISPTANQYHSAVKWDGNSITPNATAGANYLSIYTNIDANPIALYTSIGFVGIIPDGVDDRHYVLAEIQGNPLGPGIRVSQVQVGFSSIPTHSVPTPSVAWLLSSGLILLIWRVKWS